MPDPFNAENVSTATMRSPSTSKPASFLISSAASAMAPLSGSEAIVSSWVIGPYSVRLMLDLLMMELPRLFKYFSDVHYSDSKFASSDDPFKMHETRHVSSCDNLC